MRGRSIFGSPDPLNLFKRFPLHTDSKILPSRKRQQQQDPLGGEPIDARLLSVKNNKNCDEKTQEKDVPSLNYKVQIIEAPKTDFEIKIEMKTSDVVESAFERSKTEAKTGPTLEASDVKPIGSARNGRLNSSCSSVVFVAVVYMLYFSCGDLIWIS